MIGYYSKDICDWRLTAFSKGLSFLEIVGSAEIPGTLKHTIKYLEVEE